MRGAVGVVLLVSTCVHGEVRIGPAPCQELRDEEERGRGADTLGHYSNSNKAYLWPVATQTIPYFIVNDSTVGPAVPLKSTDPRVLQAVQHFEDRTCLRFTKCEREEDCPKPFIRFIAHEKSCNAQVGYRATASYRRVNLASTCSAGNTVHEIGHSIGMRHEHVRQDRDEYINVNVDNVKYEEKKRWFRATAGSDVLNLGSYDHSSIMHYGSFAFSGGGRTIRSLYLIGNRRQLSFGDQRVIDFVYNSCKAAFEKPRCLASKKAEVVHSIPYGKTWSVEFNVNYDKDVAVSYAETNTPSSLTSFKVAEGGTIPNGYGKARVEFTPTAAEVGNTYNIAACFTGTDGKTEMCWMEVKVEASKVMCFGIPSTSPEVCSGRGECTDDVALPCRCHRGYNGLDCSGYDSCIANFVSGFDDTLDSVTISGGLTTDNTFFSLDTLFYAAGGGSLRLGKDDALSTEPLTVTISTPQSTPARISFYMATTLTPERNTLFSAASCVNVELRPRQVYFNKRAVAVDVRPRHFYFFEVVNRDAGLDLWMDGSLLFKGVAPDCSWFYSSGISYMQFSGDGWLDEPRSWCTDFVQVSGTARTELSQAKLREGGLELVLTLVGGTTGWVDSEENKKRVIAGLVVDYPSPSGWNVLRDDIVTPELVSVEAEGQVLRIGPFNPSPAFSSSAKQRVRVVLDEGMFTRRRPMGWSPEELEFRIPGECDAGFHFPNEVEPSGATVGIPSLPTLLSLRAETLSFRWKMTTDAVEGGVTSSVTVLSGISGSHICLWRGLGTGNYALDVDGAMTVFQATNTADVWVSVVLRFDWTARVVRLEVNGADVEGVEATFSTTVAQWGRIEVSSSGAGVAVDGLRLTCGARPPVYAVEPACPVPSRDGITFHILPGTEPHGDGDVARVVPGSVEDPSGCLEGGVSGGFIIHPNDEATIWGAGRLEGLLEGEEYKVCYYIASSDRWVLLHTAFPTCGISVPTPNPVVSTPLPAASGCPPSHPHDACNRCWVDVSQAASSGCYPTPAPAPNGCPATHPVAACDRCWVDLSQALSGGCSACPLSHTYAACNRCWTDVQQARSGGCNQ